MMKTLSLLSCALLALPFFASADITLGSREVILDNDKLEVVRLVYPAGSESGMHSHQYPHRAAYFVKGGTLTLVANDKAKTSKTLTVVDGQILYLPAATHNVKNIGTTEVIIIETEIK